jgi:hypothetical protein
MKKSVQVVEVENEGFLALMDEVVTIFSLNYIYTGKLIGVNETCVLLESPSIVYETGAFNTKDWQDAQSLPNEIYVNLACVEAFGIVK